MQMQKSLNQLYVHLVWATWDRLPFLQDCQQRAHALIVYECEKMNIPVLAIGGMPDHVHLLAHLPLTLSVSETVKQIKGASAYVLNGASRGNVFKWQGSYGCLSVSPRDVSMMERYIQNQAEHHRDKTLMDDIELP